MDLLVGWIEIFLLEEYWTRPINDMNRKWYVLAGNWLAGAAQNVGPTTGFGYGLAPESAHVMWTKPMWTGGIMDARFGDIGYQTYHYEGLISLHRLFWTENSTTMFIRYQEKAGIALICIQEKLSTSKTPLAQ